jgi:hypothetical protein
MTKSAKVVSRDNSDLRIAVYEGFLMARYADGIDDWDIVSRKKYNGKGWRAIAKQELKKGQKIDWEPSKKKIDSKSREIQRLVEARRNKLRGIAVQDDQDDEDIWTDS